MPSLEVTHWDIIAFFVIGGIGFLFGFIAGRVYHLLDRLSDAIERRWPRK